MRYLSLLALLVLVACSSVDCPVQNTVYTSYRVYDSDGRPDTLRYVMNVFTERAASADSTDSLNYDGYVDSLLLSSASRLMEFQLPISYQRAEDTLRFEFLAADSTWICDTVYIAKTNQAHFESVDCQMSFFHDITGVRHTHNVIERIDINRPSVNYDPEPEQFHIVFKKF